ncbi:hypothetical protein MMC11_001141 [Xylographa trunciseda]|nr:hypothetical protein [Xylographa trunciseda]
MPIKWTSENDQLLLLKVLETHSITIDTKAVSAAWPTDKGEVPSARAITERVVKIRSLAKATGGGTFSVKSSQSKSPSATKMKASITPITPKKPRVKKENGIKSGVEECVSGSGKRKRNATVVKLEYECGDEGTGVENSNWLMQDEESPTKKPRTMHVEIANGAEDTDVEAYQDEV